MAKSIEEKYAYGKPVYATASVTNVRGLPSTSGKLVKQVKQGGRIGYCDGFRREGMWLWIIVRDSMSASSGKLYYVRSDVAKWDESTLTEDQKGKLAMDRVVESNQVMFSYLPVLAEKSKAARSKGVNTSTFDSRISLWAHNMKVRNEELKKQNGRTLKVQGTTADKAWAGVVKLWNRFTGLFGLGEPITITILIIAAIALVAGGALYALFGKSSVQAKGEVELAADTLDILEKSLTPEQNKKVMADIQKIADSNFEAGVDKANDDKPGFLDQLGISAKWLGYGIVGFAVYRLYMNHQHETGRTIARR